MNTLILLLAGLVCAHAAPQFVFVLPPEFLQQMQKPVGEASQFGQQPRIPAFPLESLLGSSSTLVESIAASPAELETPQPAATPVVEAEPLQAVESAPEVVTELPPIDVVAEVALALAKAQGKVPAVEEAPIETIMPVEASPVEKSAPIAEILVEEAVPAVQETPIEEVFVEEVMTVVQEAPVDTQTQEITADPTIAIQNVVPVEEIVTLSIDKKLTENNVAVEEVVIVQDANTNTVEEVIVVEDVIPSSTTTTTQSPVAVPSSTVPTITSTPTNQVVDPRMSVDPRFRNYIYVNDAPDVVAAKIALFNLQAASLPAQQVI